MTPRSAPFADDLPERPRVLLVDDDEVNLLLTSVALQDQGFDVTQAPGGEQAIRMLADWLPDIVVLDAVMPGLDGFGGHTFHTARWDYDYTGGSYEGAPMTKLADQRVVAREQRLAAALQAVRLDGRKAEHPVERPVRERAELGGHDDAPLVVQLLLEGGQEHAGTLSRPDGPIRRAGLG